MDRLRNKFKKPRPANYEAGGGSGSDNALIPGPAGMVQMAMHRKRGGHPTAYNEQGELLSTQQVGEVIAAEEGQGDFEFSIDPWRTTLTDIQKFGAIQQIPETCMFLTPIRDILNCVSQQWGQIYQVLVIIKKFEPNGLGDAMVTLKDSTGTIKASVHKKAVTQYGADLKVGAVLVLKKFAVCRFGKSRQYLNITVKNIERVYTRDNYLHVSNIAAEEVFRQMNQFKETSAAPTKVPCQNVVDDDSDMEIECIMSQINDKGEYVG